MVIVALCCLPLVGCHPVADGLPATGLTGVVVRGPTQPVCTVDVSCDAPFAAGFQVRQGDRLVATFRSDADGRFEKRLPPGPYRIVPDADAPLLSPQSQSRDVTVGTDGLTSVRLEFDTGIR